MLSINEFEKGIRFLAPGPMSPDAPQGRTMRRTGITVTAS